MCLTQMYAYFYKFVENLLYYGAEKIRKFE